MGDSESHFPQQVVGWVYVLVHGGGSVKTPLVGNWQVRDDLAEWMRRA